MSRFISLGLVLLFVLSSITPVTSGMTAPTATWLQISSRAVQGNPIAVEPRHTDSRTSTEKNSMGGSWSEYFDQTTTSEQNWTQVVDGKSQLMIDPVPWTKYVNNPVMTVNPAHFDSTAIRGNFVLYENGIYKMWYSGYDGSIFRIGYAISLDGKNWIRQNNGNPVLALGTPGSWDSWVTGQPWIVKIGNTYYMYYSGSNGVNSRLGLATSSDGITWVKNVNNPILGLGGGFDSHHLGSPAVIKDGNTWRMWYNGNDGAGDNVGYATSADGVAWNKQNNGNAVIARGAGGSFDSSGVALPWVGRFGQRFVLYYSGYNGVDYSIGAAESFDGVTWTKLNNGNAILNHGGGAAWDSSRMLEHTLVMFDNRYYMWYDGGTTNVDTKVGLAVANCYMTSGHVQSKKISLDQGMSWDRLELKKAEPAGTSVDITILDPISNLPINGFDNRTESEINISALNGLGYKSIILVAYFTGQGPSTPALYSWGVNWVAQNTWRESFIVTENLKMDPELWVRDGSVVLDADPYTWTKSALNPILDIGAGGTWDSWRVCHPDVLYNGTGYQMFYSGQDTSAHIAKIGQATSINGINWNKDASNPVLHPGAGGSWDSVHVDGSSTFFNEDGYQTYKTWVTGYDGNQWRIGYAVSPNGRTWTDYAQNPVLDSSGGGTWDDNSVTYPSVLYINGTYMMWYQGFWGSGAAIGYAHSTDGITFTKPGNSQILSPSQNQFDSYGTASPSVIYHKDQFHMFYEGVTGTQPAPGNIGYATATDGQAFTKQNNNNPVLSIGANGQWDQTAIGAPSVIFKDGLYHMYYMGWESNVWKIGYAESSFYTTGSIVTNAITTPGNGVWNSILVNKTEPSGTSVTVDVLDAKTDNAIPGFTGLTGTTLDIHDLNVNQYPSVKLRLNLMGDGTSTPIVGDVGINWTIAKVVFKGKIPDVSFLEDTYGSKLTDLSKYFNQSRIGPTKLTYSIASNTDPTHIVAIFNADKIHLDYKALVADWAGTAKMSIKASDGFMSVTSNVYNVTVMPDNDPPIWKPIPTQWLDGNKTYVNTLDLKNYVTDIDTPINDLTFSLVNNNRPNNLTIAVQSKGFVNFSTGRYFTGFVNLTVSVYDKNATVNAVFMVHINWSEPPKPPYHPPVIVSQPGLFATVGIPYVYDVNATDEDVGDVLVYMLLAEPTNMTINPFNRLITWVPSKGQVGTQLVIINVSDQRGMWVHQQFNIIVVAPNEPPYFTSTPLTTIRAGDKWVYEPKAKDNDSSYIIIIEASSPPGMNIDSAGTKMDWTPTTAGKYDVAIYAWDLQAKTYQNFTITVLPPNHPPTIDQIPDKTIKVGESYTYKVSAQDPDSDPIMYSIKDMPAGMTIGTDGTISWKPAKQDVGTYKITVTVSDGKLNANQTFNLKVLKNEVPKTMLESFLWPLLLLIIIIILIVIVAVVYSKKRKADKEAEAAAVAAGTTPAPYLQREYPAPAAQPAPVQHNVEEVVDIDDLEEEKEPPAGTPKTPETVPKKDEPSKDLIDDILGKADNVNAGQSPKAGPGAKPGPTGQQTTVRPMKKIVKKVPQETQKKNGS